MKRPYVEICHAGKFWYKLYVKNKEYINDYELLNILSKFPVISYDKSDSGYYCSAYHFDKMVQVLEKYGLDVHITSKVSHINKMLASKLSDSTIEQFQYPSEWRKGEDAYKLYDYQTTGVLRCLKRLKYIVADSVGVGKTPLAIASVLKFFDFGYKRALIICLNSLKHQWKEEIIKFSTFNNILILGEKKLVCPKNHKKFYNKKTCERCKDCYKCNDYYKNVQTLRRKQLTTQVDKQIVIMNYEQLRICFKDIINGGFDIYIADEASKMKNYRSQITKSMFKIAKNFKYEDVFIPMSGTLVENNVYEFYPVFNMIDDAIFGTWANFSNLYVQKDNWGKIVKLLNMDYLKETTSKFVIRRTIDDVWKDRPELYENLRYCELGDFQRKIYNTVMQGKMEEIESAGLDKKVGYAQCASMISYLIMVASSVETVKPSDGKDTDKYSCKLEMLKDIFTNEITTEQVIVFSKYAYKIIPLIHREFKKLKIKHLVITGEDDGNTRNEKIIKFRNKEVQVLLCSDVLGYGANLQNANYIINFDLPWNPAILSQRIARVYRRGQEKTTYIINLIAKDTVEDHVLNTIYNKKDFVEKFFKNGVVAKTTSKKKMIDDIFASMGIK